MIYLYSRGNVVNILRLTVAVALIALLCAGAAGAYTAGDPEFRAIYVDAWHAGARNVSQVNQLISDAKYCNANAIVLQVRRRGDTIYPSNEPLCSGFSSNYDALADLIQKCHNSSPRIEVHAWFVTQAIASSGAVPTNPNHPFKKYPQYLTKTSSGDQVIADDYWFDPGHPGAAQYTYNVIMDVINRYDVDGINLDYIRYGYFDAGYNDVSVARFNNFYSRYTGDFSNWRRDQLTNLVRKIYLGAISLKPTIKVTADCVAGAPAPSGQNYAATQAYSKYYQDWPVWMEQGILDMSVPMAYFDCDGSYGSSYDPWVCFTRNNAFNRHSVVAPGVYSASCLISQLSSTRNLACGPTNGAAIYAYASMNSSVMNAARAVWSTAAPVPVMPWKSSPAKGYIKGNVTFAQSVWVDGATITLTGPNNRSIYTDGTGFYGFIDLTPGSYTINCNSSTYGVKTATVQVVAGQVSSANIDYPLSSLVITNVAVSNETGTSATVTWTTNGGASSKVYYGPDRTCSQSTNENTDLVTDHSVNLTGLTPGTIYYFRVYSKNPSVDGAFSEIGVMVTTSSPDTYIVESRQGGKNYTNFVGNSVSDSAAKSTAAGLTADIGCKYGGHTYTSRSGEWSYTPIISGSYYVYGTWPVNTYAAGTLAPTWTINSAGAPIVVDIAQTSGGNAWNLLTPAPVQLNAGTKYTVKLQSNMDGIENKRTYWDSVKWEFVTESVPPSTPSGLAFNDVQEESISIGWTPSTDNVGVAGYRISRGPNTNALSVVDISPTNSYVDTNVAPNLRYYYSVSAYDTSGNKSGDSTKINTWSMCSKPTMTSITCNKHAGVWHTSGSFDFTAVGGMGAGKPAANYRVVFDTDLYHEWTGAEPVWVGGVKSFTPESSALPYYLHIRGNNQGLIPGEPNDLGPYYIDTTAPQTPTVTPVGAASATSLSATWSADDPESGVVSYQYAVGTSAGATDVVNWTATEATEKTITFAAQPLGTTLYVCVKAKNAAGSWSSVGTSQGRSIALQVDSIAAAKALDNSGLGVYIKNVYVSAVFGDSFYVQDGKHGPGIRCEGSCPYDVGTMLDVGGVLGVNAVGERALTDAYVVAIAAD